MGGRTLLDIILTRATGAGNTPPLSFATIPDEIAEAMQLLRWLVDGSMGPPGPQGAWGQGMRFAFHGSNAVACLCFTAATLILWNYVWKGSGFSKRWAFCQTAVMPAVALKCLARVLEWNGPRYNATTLLDIDTAVWAAVMVAMLPFTLKASRQRRVDYHRQNNELHAANLRLAEARVDAEDGRREAEKVGRDTAKKYVDLRRMFDRHNATIWVGLKAEELASLEAIDRELRS